MEFNAAKETYCRLKSRYEQYLRKLERLKPEIEASRRYLLILKQSISSHENDNLIKSTESLAQRCPTHVWRIIFELVVCSSSKESLRMAIYISHVCQAWRTIALQTPSLWSRIDISMMTDVKTVEEMQGSLVKRLKSKSADVTLKGILLPTSGVTQPVIEFMEACKLHSFHQIGTLQFQPIVSDDAIQLTHPAFRYSRGPLERLIIKCHSISKTATKELVLSELWSNFPTVKHISLIKVHDVIFGAPIPLTSLLLQQLQRQVRASQIALLTRLIELTLVEVAFFSDAFQFITLPYLETLITDNCINTPWSRIITPNIKNCYIYNETLATSNFADYVCRSPTLQRLVAPLTKDAFRRVAVALPNLEFLDIAGYYQGLFRWRDLQLSSPPFPRLSTIRINLTYDQVLSLKEFEEIVKARCLPGPGLRRLADLHVADSVEKMEVAPWRNSKYLKKCTQTMHRDRGWEKGVISIEMKWLK
jgi:hypothetical protein